MFVVFEGDYYGATTPTQPSPIEVEGSPWQRASDLPRKTVAVIERHHTSAGAFVLWER